MGNISISQLRKIIRELVEEELEEVSSTDAGTPGFMIPGAFRGNSAEGKAKQRKNADNSGYKMVGDQEEADSMEGDDPWKQRPMGEAVLLSKLPKVRAYINSIKNADKKAYAELYLKWKATDQKKDPPSHGNLGTMGAQAVRMNIDDILGEQVTHYHQFRTAEGSPSKKIAHAIREMDRGLREVEKTLRLSSRLKKETKAAIWSRSNRALTKMEQKLSGMLYKIRELKQ